MMRKHIKLLASEYEVGDQSDLIECPFCKGGGSGKKSFTMNIKPEGVVYICYRASCSVRGFVPNLRTEGYHIRDSKVKLPKPFTADRSPLPEEMVSLLLSKFPCITEDIIKQEQIQYSYDRRRVLLPMFDIRGYMYGVQARSYTELPKAISYFDNVTTPKLHFPLGYNPSSHVVLVEDHFSSMILCAEGVPSIALLGTNLSDQEVAHLAAYGVSHVTFFLDADAAHKAIKFKKQYGLEFRSAVYYHKQDPKDLNAQEIQEFKEWLTLAI